MEEKCISDRKSQAGEYVRSRSLILNIKAFPTKNLHTHTWAIGILVSSLERATSYYSYLSSSSMRFTTRKRIQMYVCVCVRC